MRKIITWLGSVKSMGMSLQQITPFLEAYETSGHLQPLLSKLMLRAMADLDQRTIDAPGQEFSPEDYSICVGQLHEIICSAPAGQDVKLPPFKSLGVEQDSPAHLGPQTTAQTTAQTANGRDLHGVFELPPKEQDPRGPEAGYYSGSFDG